MLDLGTLSQETMPKGATGLRASDRKARIAVFRVALWFHFHGFGIEIPEPRFAPSLADIDDYLDDGDLFLRRQQERMRVEVKHRHDMHFTGAADYPFRTVYFSNPDAVERHGNDVDGYFCVNAAMTHAVVIDRSTRKHWCLGRAWMKNSDKVEGVWEINRDLASYVDLRVKHHE